MLAFSYLHHFYMYESVGHGLIPIVRGGRACNVFTAAPVLDPGFVKPFGHEKTIERTYGGTVL